MHTHFCHSFFFVYLIGAKIIVGWQQHILMELYANFRLFYMDFLSIYAKQQFLNPRHFFISYYLPIDAQIWQKVKIAVRFAIYEAASKTD